MALTSGSFTCMILSAIFEKSPANLINVPLFLWSCHLVKRACNEVPAAEAFLKNSGTIHARYRGPIHLALHTEHINITHAEQS